MRYLGSSLPRRRRSEISWAKLAAKYRDLMFCYEAGPTGYGLYRLLKSLDHECLVVAPYRIGRHAKPVPTGRIGSPSRICLSSKRSLQVGQVTSSMAMWVTLGKIRVVDYSATRSTSQSASGMGSDCRQSMSSRCQDRPMSSRGALLAFKGKFPAYKKRSDTRN